MLPQEVKIKATKNFKEIIQEKVLSRIRKARLLANVSEAIQEYQQVLFLDRGNLIALKELSQLHESQGDLSAAIVCLQQYLQIQPQSDVEERLRLLILQRGQSLCEQGDWNNFLEGTEFDRFGMFLQIFMKDVQHLRSRKEIEPAAYKAFVRAHCFALTNHLVYALQEVEVALKINQTVLEFFLLRGKLLWALNKEPAGNFDFWKAHSLNPDHAEVQEFLKHVLPKTEALITETKFLIIQNATEKCQLNIKRGLELYPGNTELLLIKSYLHRSNGEYEQALIDLDLCLRSVKEKEQEGQIHHQIALTYNEMAMFLFQKGKFEDSLTLFNEALKYKSQDWGIIVNRGDTHKELGKSDAALADYQTALNIAHKPEIVQRVLSMLSLKGIDHFNKRHYDQALSFFERALQLSPQQADILLRRGKCHLELQNYAHALADFTSVVSLDPGNFEASQMVISMRSNHRDKGPNIIYVNNEEDI